MATQPQPQPQPQATLHPIHLLLCDSDLAKALESLQSAVKLPAVRTLRIVLTETNILHWHGSLWPGVHVVFDEELLKDYERLYPAPISSRPTSELFRAILRLIAESLDLSKLDLEVDARKAWRLFEDAGAGAYGGDEVDEEWKFIYDFYMDVGRAVAEVFKGSDLREVRIWTSIWDGMGQWLVGQITGNGREAVVAGILPKHHDVGMRLLPGEGVNEPKEEEV